MNTKLVSLLAGSILTGSFALAIPLVSNDVPAVEASKASKDALQSSHSDFERVDRNLSHENSDLQVGEMINLNTASQDQLERLPGISSEKAQAIIAARPFQAKEDIKKIDGLQGKAYARIKSYITVK